VGLCTVDFVLLTLFCWGVLGVTAAAGLQNNVQHTSRPGVFAKSGLTQCSREENWEKVDGSSSFVHANSFVNKGSTSAHKDVDGE